MPVLTASLNLRTKAPREAEEWILALIRTLQGKSANWKLTIGSREEHDIAFEVSPPLSSEEIAELAHAALTGKDQSRKEKDGGK